MLLLLLGPGVLLHALLSPRRRAVELPLYAAASWVVLFWWLRLVPGDWLLPVACIGAGAFAAGVLLWRPIDRASAVVWLAAAALFALLQRSALVAPGVDGAMHTAVARVIADAHGHPASFRPLWPLDFFHSYPVGLPALLALLAQLGGLDWREAGLAGHALAYALVLIAFAAATARWAGSALGLAVGTAAVLAARSPLYYWTWGGGPNVLGMAFGVAALAAGIDALAEAEAPGAAVPACDRLERVRSAGACALFAAASLLTHGVTVAAFGYAALPLVAFALLRPALRRRLPLLFGAGGLALLLLSPWLFSLRAVLGPGELAWVRATIRDAASLRLFPAALHDVPLIAGALGAAIVLRREPRRAALPLALAALLALLVLNGRSSTLPLSVLLYPDRIAVLLLLPAAWLVSDALRGRPRLAALCAVALLPHAFVLQRKMLRAGEDHALATAADLRVLAALPDCPIWTNYGDAGQWIPALAGRPITFPQVNVLFFDEVESTLQPCAAFRGEKRAYSIDTVPCPRPGCRLVRRDGGAELFELTDPPLFHLSAYH